LIKSCDNTNNLITIEILSITNNIYMYVNIDINDGVTNPNSSYSDPFIVEWYDQNSVKLFYHEYVVVNFSPDILNSKVLS